MKMQGLGSIVVAAISFVGTHFLLAHPLRKPFVGAVGEGVFLGIYSALAAVTLGWLVWPIAPHLRRHRYGRSERACER
jgi:uncharacterized membrane protein